MARLCEAAEVARLGGDEFGVVMPLDIAKAGCRHQSCVSAWNKGPDSLSLIPAALRLRISMRDCQEFRVRAAG